MAVVEATHLLQWLSWQGQVQQLGFEGHGPGRGLVGLIAY